MTEQPIRPDFTLRVRGRAVPLGPRTLVMGVVNVTPDSFSDGGRFFGSDAAIRHGEALAAEGADILDVGGESTRPGAAPVPPAEQVRRVAPVLAALRERTTALLSIDTASAEVAAAALDAGADIVNDVSGLTWDPALAPLVARRGAPAVLMHLRGPFERMHAAPSYADVVGEVKAELAQALARATEAGIAQVILDPGIGFSKRAEHSLELMQRLDELHALGRPLLVGPSRKSFIGHLTGSPAGDRAFGTAAAVTACVLKGAHVVRVHDVAAMVQVVKVADALRAPAPVVA